MKSASTDTLAIDAHAHIFCWGENPQQGFLSAQTKKRWLTKLLIWLTGIGQEPGENLSAKMKHRLLRQLAASRLDYCILLAQDAVYTESGTRNDAATHFYVANDYVLQLAAENEKILPGCSINPHRRDALAELERCVAAGACLIKVHTAIQGVDPSLKKFEPFYARAAELGIPLTFHTGYEHACSVVSQSFADPARLSRALDQGGVVIAAHCGTCAVFDREDFYPSFVRMMGAYDNLYGETAVMATLIRWHALRRLRGEGDEFCRRIIHGSDYPLPPSRLPYLRRVGWFPEERRNPLDLDLRIKQSFEFSRNYESQVVDLLAPSVRVALQKQTRPGAVASQKSSG